MLFRSLGRATSDFESAAPGKTGGEYDETDSDGDGAGEREAEHTGHDDASRVTTKLRFVDGAIASNNPTAVGVFEGPPVGAAVGAWYGASEGTADGS